MLRKISLITFLIADSVLQCSVSQVLAQSVPEPATVLDAVVSSNSTLIRGERVVSSTNLSDGKYGVFFDKDVSKCAYSATLRDNPGFITAARNANNYNGVIVSTYDPNAILTNNSFNLIVACPRN